MKNTLGNRFKQIRTQYKMTQKEFAESLGVTQTTISGIEKDAANPSLTLVKLVSLKYSINENWILNGAGEIFFFSELRKDDILGLFHKLDAMKNLLNENIEILGSVKNELLNIWNAVKSLD